MDHSIELNHKHHPDAPSDENMEKGQYHDRYSIICTQSSRSLSVPGSFTAPSYDSGRGRKLTTSPLPQQHSFTNFEILSIRFSSLVDPVVYITIVAGRSRDPTASLSDSSEN